KQIHAGFWYDDGTVPFIGGGGAAGPIVEAYCRALGHPAPRVVNAALAREAAAFDALAREDADAVLAALGDRWCTTGPARRAAAWLVARATPAELPGLVDRAPVFAAVAAQRAAERGPFDALDLVGRLGSTDAGQRAFQDLARFPRTAEIAGAIVAAGF